MKTMLVLSLSLSALSLIAILGRTSGPEAVQFESGHTTSPIEPQAQQSSVDCGKAKIGMTQPKVRQLLGPSEQVTETVTKFGTTEVWGYGSLSLDNYCQVIFQDGAVSMTADW